MLHIHHNRPVLGLLPVQCMLRGWRACIFISILSLKVYINIVVHSLFPTALRQKIWKCCSTGIRSAPLRHPPPTSPERPTGVRCVCPAWPTRSPVCPLSLPAGICWMMMVDGVLWSWFPAPRGEKGIRYRKKEMHTNDDMQARLPPLLHLCTSSWPRKFSMFPPGFSCFCWRGKFCVTF